MSPAQPKIRAVIFDIGRVLIRVDVGSAMNALGVELSMPAAEVWAAIEKDPRWPDLQEGRMAGRDWYLHLSRRLGVTLTFEQFTQAWNQALDPQPLQNDSLFEGLKKNYRLALLSNTDPIHVAHMEASFSFFNYFPEEARIYSCRVAASKPNPIVYREALRACKVKAEEAVFIDDIPAYVEAARSLGLSGIVYQGAEQLRVDFRHLGIQIAA
jgi:glucose-1-phosphatase